ncbi:unnamed protein product [Darwinula stevensoni]|uniref:Peptidase M13 C-terminal domain-containing protein n=1 Tax=Darwinula stevensoni TaxID=69355 RepID=A0A7R9ACW9_9CRUS|nr:unnamed protein product [Darwinula stevensoni]CAG0900782.1 unnamed protein product [Darwinula stevensoni]
MHGYRVCWVQINGRLSMGENIADNGGIREAFRAYELYVRRHGEDKPLPGLTEFTQQQLFFLSFANGNCAHARKESMALGLRVNVHSPFRYRVIGSLSNLQAFRETWHCSDSPMAPNPEDTCTLW